MHHTDKCSTQLNNLKKKKASLGDRDRQIDW